MSVEAEKAHNLSAANWRSRKARGVVVVQIQRPEDVGSWWHRSQSQSQGLRSRSTDVQGQEIDISVQAESRVTFLCHFVLFRSLADWMIVLGLVRAPSFFSLPRRC